MDRGFAIVEQAHTLPYGNRMDHQVQFLDETGCQQLANHKVGSAHRDLRLARLVRQRGDRPDEIA
jgi:hypothetical protein